MATPDEVITIPRLRQAIGGVGDSEDALLTAYRNSGIRWIENWTGRKIADVDGWRTESTDFYHFDIPDIITFRVSDVKTGDLVVHYRNADDDPTGQSDQTLTIATTESRVKLDRDAVYIYYEGDDSWTDLMRFSHPVPILECNRGMAAADIPPPFIDACALIVRALYDGSAYDGLDKMSALNLLLSPYVLNAYMRSVR